MMLHVFNSMPSLFTDYGIVRTAHIAIGQASRLKASEEPYITHLLEVATLVAEATDGQDPDLVIAALLHDAMEDQEVPRGIIADAFGEQVATFVEEVSDDKNLLKSRFARGFRSRTHTRNQTEQKFSSSRTRPAT